MFEIVLRNGVTVHADGEVVRTKYNAVTNELTGVDWRTPPGARRQLVYLRVEEISAITHVEEAK